MDKDEFNIEVLDDALVVSGEKRFERERTEGALSDVAIRLRKFSPRRVVPLPVPVLTDASKASYNAGVLKIELTKAKPGKLKV